MDIESITSLISTLGFPIVMVGALGWYIISKDKVHAEQIASFVDALNKNTIAITELSEKLKG